MAAQGQVITEAPESGFYQAPTLLRDVPPQHRLAREEVFGPVLAALPFADEDEALALANGTPYGLVAGTAAEAAGFAVAGVAGAGTACCCAAVDTAGGGLGRCSRSHASHSMRTEKPKMKNRMRRWVSISQAPNPGRRDARDRNGTGDAP